MIGNGRPLSGYMQTVEGVSSVIGIQFHEAAKQTNVVKHVTYCKYQHIPELKGCC